MCRILIFTNLYFTRRPPFQDDGPKAFPNAFFLSLAASIVSRTRFFLG